MYRSAVTSRWIGRCRERDRRQLDGGRMEREVRDPARAQRQDDAGPRLGREPQGAYLDQVGPAHFDILEQAAASGPRGDLPTAPVQGVGDPNGGTCNGHAVLAHDPALKRGGRDALRNQQSGQQCKGQQLERPPHFSERSFWKRGWLRSGSQVGSMRSHGTVSCPGMERSCSSWATAASYSPTIV